MSLNDQLKALGASDQFRLYVIGRGARAKAAVILLAYGFSEEAIRGFFSDNFYLASDELIEIAMFMAACQNRPI
jgi:hypothetical protein